MDTSKLAKRMKEFYEEIPKNKLMRRCPVVIRCDGRSFHTLTRNFKRPFDEVLLKPMQETTKYMCENIQGCVLGYTQSDEISLVLIDYKRLDSQAWFDYEVQKMCSIAASMATMAFNKFFAHEVAAQSKRLYTEYLNDNDSSYIDALEKALNKGAMFDARVFNVPKEEVANYIYWRQLDASRNSIQMVGQANFSHRALQNKSCNDIQDMLMDFKGINWNDLPAYQKRGSCVIRIENTETIREENIGTDGSVIGTKVTVRPKWVIDKNIPIFKGGDRKYIEDLVMVGE